MPVTVDQDWNGSEVEISDAGEASIRSEYIIRGTSDEFTAEASLLAATAATVSSLVKKSVRITERLADDAWRGEVLWSRTISQQQLQQSGGGGNLDSGPSAGAYEFDTSGGTAHISQSLETISSQDDGSLFYDPPDFKGAINVTPDSIEGVDITVPEFRWSETHERASVTPADQLVLRNLTGKTNDATFRSHAAGEVLFMGVRGAKRNGSLWELTFSFAASPNATGLSVGDITGISKKGWEYLWVHYQDTEDAAAKALVKRPLAAYVERVYDEADFTLLGI